MSSPNRTNKQANASESIQIAQSSKETAVTAVTPTAGADPVGKKLDESSTMADRAEMPAPSDPPPNNDAHLAAIILALPPRAADEYDALLPTTEKGIMIKIKHCFTDGSVSFDGYNRFQNGDKSPSELRNLCREIGDQIIAIDGVFGMRGQDSVETLKVKGRNSHVHIRFRKAGLSSSAPSSGTSTVDQTRENQAVDTAQVGASSSLDSSIAKAQTERANEETNAMEAIMAAAGDAEQKMLPSAFPSAKRSGEVVGEPKTSILAMKRKNNTVKETRSDTASLTVAEIAGATVTHQSDVNMKKRTNEEPTTTPAPLQAAKIRNTYLKHDEKKFLERTIKALAPLEAEEYDVVLPTTKRGTMIKVKKNVDGKGTSFDGYVQFSNGLKTLAELRNLCGDIGDRLVAINGVSVLEKEFEDINDMLDKVCEKKHIHIRFRSNAPESAAKVASNLQKKKHVKPIEGKVSPPSDTGAAKKPEGASAKHPVNPSTEDAGNDSDDTERARMRTKGQNVTKTALTFLPTNTTAVEIAGQTVTKANLTLPPTNTIAVEIVDRGGSLKSASLDKIATVKMGANGASASSEKNLSGDKAGNNTGDSSVDKSASGMKEDKKLSTNALAPEEKDPSGNMTENKIANTPVNTSTPGIEEAKMPLASANQKKAPAVSASSSRASIASSDTYSALEASIAALPPLASEEYDAFFPTTEHGIMIRVRNNPNTGAAMFNGYHQGPNGLKGPAESQNLCESIGDTFVAVGGISVLGKDYPAVISMIRAESKNKRVHARFRRIVSKQPATASVNPTDRKQSDQQKNTLSSGQIPKKQPADQASTKYMANAASLGGSAGSSRIRPHTSPEGLAVLEVLQNEAVVVLTSPPTKPKKIDLSNDGPHFFERRVIARRNPPLNSAGRHIAPPGRAKTVPPAPTNALGNNISAATTRKRLPTTDDEELRKSVSAPPATQRRRKTITSSDTIARSDANKKQRKENTIDLTGKKMRMIEAKWTNAYDDSELRSIMAVTYAMDLSDVKQQEQARTFLNADNEKYRKSLERKKASSTGAATATHRGKRPAPVARTAGTAKRRYKTDKRPPLVDPDNDADDDVTWVSKSVSNYDTSAKASPRLPPKLVFEGPPTVDVFQNDNQWPESWKATRKWPTGWKVRVFERRGGVTKGSTDRYWYSPKTQKKLRSILAVKRFAEAVDKCGGDEEKAWISSKG